MYHCGFSHGFNVGEAVNLAPYDWLEYNKQAYLDYAKDNFSKKASFTHEWIVLENIKHSSELSFSKPVLTEVSIEAIY